jgi:hypothetical protein
VAVLAWFAAASLFDETMIAAADVRPGKIDAYAVWRIAEPWLCAFVYVYAYICSDRLVQAANEPIFHYTHLIASVVTHAVAIVALLAVITHTVAAQKALIGTTPHSRVAAAAAPTATEGSLAVVTDV